MTRRIAGWIIFLLGGFTRKAGPGGSPDPIAELKTTGERITVNFDQCEIRSHDYTEPIAPDDPDAQFTSIHYLPLDSSPALHDIRQSVIIFTHLNTRTDRMEKFYSPIIPKDEVTLSFYLDRQKQTTLYVDTTNRRLYYLDLDFLKE